ncbi:hypothetical protein C1H46_020588 [Malus baccata]|uniref:Uncharacterized protein n=1 Tax=Malus baccata TaxID=106549 RepID=A0A540M549_MALBA|nr:hypothetical protein C1H46_020588 [Malus baccata]
MLTWSPAKEGEGNGAAMAKIKKRVWGRDDREIGGEDAGGFDEGDEVTGTKTGRSKKEMEAGRGRTLGRKGLFGCMVNIVFTLGRKGLFGCMVNIVFLATCL